MLHAQAEPDAKRSRRSEEGLASALHADAAEEARRPKAVRAYPQIMSGRHPWSTSHVPSDIKRRTLVHDSTRLKLLLCERHLGAAPHVQLFLGR